MKKNPMRSPLGWIKAKLRGEIWMKSRERGYALKTAHNCCESCGAKGRPKDTRNGPKCILEVHHIEPIDWSGLTDLIARRILPPPDRLRVLCRECHKKEHEQP